MSYHRDPVHASGLHCYGPNPALLQPIRHRLQLAGGTSEAPHRLLVPARRYSYIVGFVADINAGGIRMYHFQADIFTLDLPHHLAPVACGSSHSNGRALKGSLLSGFSPVAWLSC
jgi:hypothetical protein